VYSLALIVRPRFVGSVGECEPIVISSSGLTTSKSQRALMNSALIPWIVIDALLISNRYQVRKPRHVSLNAGIAVAGNSLLCIVDDESVAVSMIILMGSGW
jgi:hypothetical protein